MKRTLSVSAVAVGALALALACGKKNEDSGPAPGSQPASAPTAGKAVTPPAPGEPAHVAPPARPQPADTTSLWALAPTDATFGFVIGDGVGLRALRALNHLYAKVADKPFAKKLVDEIAEARKQSFDFLDEAAYKGPGIDLSKGMAVFVGAGFDKPLLIVLPIVDRQAFRTLAHGKVDKVGDREVDRLDDVICLPGDRYICAESIDLIDSVLKPHDAALTAAVKALPADQRGDVEVYVDLAKTSGAAHALAEMKVIGDFSAASLSARLDPGGVTFRETAVGKLSPVASMFAGVAPPAEFADLGANSATVIRAHFDPKVLVGTGMPAQMPIEGADLRTDLIDQLTGDIEAITAGKGIMAGVVLFKIQDAARVKKAVVALCNLGKSAPTGLVNVVVKDDSCTGEISYAWLTASMGVSLPNGKISLAVSGNLLQLTLGEVDLAAIHGSPAADVGSPEAKEILTGNETIAMWSRSASIDLSQFPKALVDKMLADPATAEQMKLFAWIGSLAYEAAFGVTLTPTGVQAVLRFTAFGDDPADAHAAYDAASDKLLTGDRASYLAALTDVAAKFPGSLAAKRAKLELTNPPAIGPVVGLMGAGAALYLGERMPPPEPAEPVEVPPPAGNGSPQHAPAAPASGGEPAKP